MGEGQPQRETASGCETPARTPYCPECGYNLTGLLQDRCPECGLVGAVEHAITGGDPRHFRAVKRWCVGIFTTVWLLAYTWDTLAGHSAPIGFLTFISAAVAAWAWCRSDSALRGYATSGSELLLIFLVLSFGVPIYLIGHRRWWSLGKGIVLLIALFVIGTALSSLVYRAYHGSWPAF
jgi:hypothetical protein